MYIKSNRLSDMKSLMMFLIMTFGVLQYKLWFAGSGIPEVYRLQESVDLQMSKNNKVRLVNLSLEAQIQDLKSGSAAVEERARSELGMVKRGEVLYQFIEGKSI